MPAGFVRLARLVRDKYKRNWGIVNFAVGRKEAGGASQMQSLIYGYNTDFLGNFSFKKGY